MNIADTHTFIYIATYTFHEKCFVVEWGNMHFLNAIASHNGNIVFVFIKIRLKRKYYTRGKKKNHAYMDIIINSH